MSIASTDILAYGSASMPEDDSSTSGGAIDTTCKVVFTDISAADTVEIVSDSAGDTTQTVTVYGRSAAGAVVSDALSLNGTTVVNGVVTFERILKVVVSASHAGTITIRKASDNVTIATLETGLLLLRRLFYAATAEASGGSSKDFYEKIFIKNTHATLTLLSATISENADPSSNITFALANSLNDTESVANRLTAPASVGTFNSSDKSAGDIAAASRQGVWLKLTLAAGAAAAKSTYTLRTSGSST